MSTLLSNVGILWFSTVYYLTSLYALIEVLFLQTLETNTLSHKDRLEWILAVDWPPLSTKEEAVMRCCITGDLLKR